MTLKMSRLSAVDFQKHYEFPGLDQYREKSLEFVLQLKLEIKSLYKELRTRCVSLRMRINTFCWFSRWLTISHDKRNEWKIYLYKLRALKPPIFPLLPFREM